MDDPEFHSTSNLTCQCPTLIGSHLKILAPEGTCARLSRHTASFEALTGVPVTVDCISKRALAAEIINDARLQTRLYDGYVYTPTIMGELVSYDLLTDLTPFVRSSSNLDWMDIFMFNREHGAVYNKKVVAIPLDGDVLSLYYRKDLFSKYNKKPPRTWEEYTELAKFFHGKEELIPNSNETTTITGSCVTRIGGYSYYHAYLVLSSMTQTSGTKTGVLFDPTDMRPLLGEAYVKALQFLEEQFVYGAVNEYNGTYANVTSAYMNSGRCAMTYDFGTAFTEHSKAPPASVIKGLLGTDLTPGSRSYLDRTDGKLKPCEDGLCSCRKSNEDEDDDGCINSAPYAASIGWVGSCSNFSTPSQQSACEMFFAHVASPGVSIGDVIPPVQMGSSDTVTNPFRNSQANADDWITKGYPAESAKSYLSTISSQLNDENTALDLRIPGIPKIGPAIYFSVWNHLTMIKEKVDMGLKPPHVFSTEEERWEIVNKLDEQLRAIVVEYDNDSDNTQTLLEHYQRNLGIYSPKINMNYITKIRPIGFTAAVIIMLSSIGFALWSYKKRNMNVVRASQPIFLAIICMGTFIMGSTIIPLSIDDEIATIQGCNVACMSAPWLFCVGFTTIFAALFSKVWRLNIIMKQSARYKKTKVTVRDVLLPFVVLISLNFSLLTVWSIIDPLQWTRTFDNKSLNSYGSCRFQNVSSIVLASLLAVVNICALILANIQVYRSRNHSTNFNEGNHVALAMGSLFQGTALGLPILYIARDNIAAVYFVKMTLILVISMSILLFIFVPKFYYEKNRRAANERKRQTSIIDSINSKRNSGCNRRSIPGGLTDIKMAMLQRFLEDEGVNVKEIFEKCDIQLNPTSPNGMFAKV